MSNTTPQELMDDYESVFEGNNRALVGRADAVYHVGKVLAGDWSLELVESLQAELADPSEFNYDARYHFGYLTGWNAVAGLIRGLSLKDIAKADN